MLENLKITSLTDTEILLGKMVINTLVSGKTAKVMGTGQKYGKMEENIQERLKMTNCTEEELFIILMVKST